MMRPLLLAACAQALITPSPVRPVATRLRARTADGMSKGWKVLRLSEEEGNAISLAANSKGPAGELEEPTAKPALR